MQTNKNVKENSDPIQSSSHSSQKSRSASTTRSRSRSPMNSAMSNVRKISRSKSGSLDCEIFVRSRSRCGPNSQKARAVKIEITFTNLIFKIFTSELPPAITFELSPPITFVQIEINSTLLQFNQLQH